MKIREIYENTTAGSIAPTEHAFVKMQTRSPSVYGDQKVGSLLKGKKTNKPFVNSINEGAVKQYVMDLKELTDEEFKKKYKKTKQEARKAMKEKPEPVNEADLQEDDIIVVPGQGRLRKTGFVKHGQSRVDHEVEMARSDLFSAAKNAKQVLEIIQSVSEEEGLEGWVQEKIIKANDYLNTVREYLEGKQVQGVAEGLGKDIKRLATGNDAKSRAGQEIAKSQDASIKGDTKTSKKHFDRFDKLDKLASKEQGVAEGKRNLKCVCKTQGQDQCPVHAPLDEGSTSANKNKKVK